MKNQTDSSAVPASKQVISRYMSFGKFLDILRRERLYFASLASFTDDRHEGSSTVINSLIDTGFAAALDVAVNYSFPAALTPDLSAEERRARREKGEQIMLSRPALQTAFGPFDIENNEMYKHVLEGQRRWLDASCWHKGEDESLAMWKIYGGSSESVALKTTVARLRRAMRPSADEVVIVEPVHYIDHRNQHFQSDNVLAPALHKQKPYEYEQEVRAIAWNPSAEILCNREPRGRYVEVDLQELLMGVRVSPKAQLWFRELVQAEVDKVTVGVEVTQSVLDGDPVRGYPE